MSNSHIVLIALRIAALYVALQAFLHLSSLCALARVLSASTESQPYLIGEGTTVLLLTVSAILLFLLAPAVAYRSSGAAGAAPMEDRHEIGALALRLLGVLLWCRALEFCSQLAAVVMSGAGAVVSWGLGTVLVSMLVLAGTGTWLCLSGRRLAPHMFRGRPDVPASSLAPQIQAIAFSVVGLGIVAFALPDFLLLASRRLDEWQGGSPDPIRLVSGPHWIGTLSSLALGIALFLGGSGISGFWSRVRGAGRAVARAGLEPRDKGI